MIKYNKEIPLIYIHVPKCAGISVKRQFEEWFGNRLIKSYPDERKGSYPKKRRLKKIFTGRYIEGVCVYGHFNSNRGFGVSDLYPEVKQFVSIIRDPAEVVVSNYYYLKKVGEEWVDQSRIPKSNLESYVEKCDINYLNHFPEGIREDNIGHYIDKYFVYIGIAEDLQFSLKRLAVNLNLQEPKKIGYLNRTKRGSNIDYDYVRKVVRQRFSLEYDFYEYVKCKYASW